MCGSLKGAIGGGVSTEAKLVGRKPTPSI